jgi:hypothetical protein
MKRGHRNCFLSRDDHDRNPIGESVYMQKKMMITSFLCVSLLTGCGNSLLQKRFSHVPNSVVASVASDITLKDKNVITGIGYASVSTQAADSIEQKRLMAIRVARLIAMRDLAEQIHGMQVDSNTSIMDEMLRNDSLRSSVRGLVRGARTVRINPVNSDTYEAVLEVDSKRLGEAIMAGMHRK